MSEHENLVRRLREDAEHVDSYVVAKNQQDAADTIERLRAALRAYERWEADLFMCDGAWIHGLPHMTQGLYDRWIEIQQMRNAALKEDAQ